MFNSQSDEKLDALFRFSLAKVKEWEQAVGQDGVKQIQGAVLRADGTSVKDLYTGDQLKSYTPSERNSLDQIVKDYVQFKKMLSAIGMTLSLSEKGLRDVVGLLENRMPGIEHKLKIYVGFIVQEMELMIKSGGTNGQYASREKPKSRWAWWR